jgi:hypothetical protein
MTIKKGDRKWIALLFGLSCLLMVVPLACTSNDYGVGNYWAAGVDTPCTEWPKIGVFKVAKKLEMSVGGAGAKVDIEGSLNAFAGGTDEHCQSQVGGEGKGSVTFTAFGKYTKGEIKGSGTWKRQWTEDCTGGGPTGKCIDPKCDALTGTCQAGVGKGFKFDLCSKISKLCDKLGVKAEASLGAAGGVSGSAEVKTGKGHTCCADGSSTDSFTAKIQAGIGGSVEVDVTLLKKVVAKASATAKACVDGGGSVGLACGKPFAKPVAEWSAAVCIGNFQCVGGIHTHEFPDGTMSICGTLPGTNKAICTGPFEPCVKEESKKGVDACPVGMPG